MLNGNLFTIIDTQLGQVITVFLGDKHAAGFFNQVQICCSRTLIVDN
jgi:hypothetical protein